MLSSGGSTQMANGFDIHGRHVLVTGASSGLGRYFARMLAADGALVTLAARREAALQAVVDEIVADGGEARSVVMDVTSEASVQAAFAAAEVDGRPPSIVINNAGVARTNRALETSAEEFDGVLDTNLRGAFLVAREAAARMVAADIGGSIVNIASILGLGVAGAVMPYAVSKAGLLHMTRSLALEWARHGIRVNALAPGYVETDLNADFLASEAGGALRKRIPMRRFGRLEELAGPLRLLVSDAGAYMTGSVVTVDGGHLVASL